MSALWQTIIAVVTSLNVLGCLWLIWWTARRHPGEVPEGEVKNLVWDGDLRERNNPMPRWWLILFYLTIGFAFLYFLLYPAIGRGVLGWSEDRQYDEEIARAQREYAPLYASYAGRSILDLSRDPKALALGRSLFANICINCHGSDARGAPGFPNLTEKERLYGDSPDAILQTIAHGREGIMPPLGAALGTQGVDDVIDYVLSLNGQPQPAAKVADGQARFALCATCHGADANGNPAIGAPSLIGQNWLYGGSPATLRRTVTDGRHGKMPAHEWLGDAKVRLLAAYVYSLSHVSPP